MAHGYFQRRSPRGRAKEYWPSNIGGIEFVVGCQSEEPFLSLFSGQALEAYRE